MAGTGNKKKTDFMSRMKVDDFMVGLIRTVVSYSNVWLYLMVESVRTKYIYLGVVTFQHTNT